MGPVAEVLSNLYETVPGTKNAQMETAAARGTVALGYYVHTCGNLRV